ncbi:hypothetical protein E4U59_007736 [Claviceps monticola]|nr:hypothetical protein E4U59_007736 [Claviceps monticola]
MHPIRNQQHRLNVVHQLCVSRALGRHPLTSLDRMNSFLLALVSPTLYPHDTGVYVEPRLRSVDSKANFQRALELSDGRIAHPKFRYVAYNMLVRSQTNNLLNSVTHYAGNMLGTHPY